MADAPASGPAAAGSKRTPEQVVVHPLVLLSVVDHYNRVAKDTKKRVVGVLLGESYKGRVDATNSFAGGCGGSGRRLQAAPWVDVGCGSQGDARAAMCSEGHAWRVPAPAAMPGGARPGSGRLGTPQRAMPGRLLAVTQLLGVRLTLGV